MRILRLAAFVAALFVLAVPILQPAIAFAQEAATVVAPDATTVVVPVGNWLDAVLANALEIVVAGIGLVVAFVLRSLPKGIADIIRTVRVEQLLGRAVDYGINAVRGAVRDKALTVDVGSKVVAEAAQYAIDQAPGRLIEWAGGPEAIKKMVLARISLTSEAEAADVLDQAPPVTGE